MPCKRQFFPSNMWAPGIALSLAGLAASTAIHQAISLTHTWNFNLANKEGIHVIGTLVF